MREMQNMQDVFGAILDVGRKTKDPNTESHLIGVKNEKHLMG